MSIPQNFDTVEQQILSVTNSGAQVQFTLNPPAGKATGDLMLFNGGSKGCQVAIGSTQTLATAVQDASANGTTQTKVGAGAYILIRKVTGKTWVGAITEGADTTTLYCHAGIGQ